MVDESKQELQHPIILEILAEDPHDSDPVALGEVGRGILAEMKQDGIRVEPVYTGQRGGGHELLFEILNYVQTTGQVVWADIYAQGNTLGVISSIVTILGAVSPSVKRIFHAREKHEEKQAKLAAATSTPPAQEQHPIKIILTIDGAAIPVEVTNFQDAKAILELAQQFHAQHPNVNATPQSEVKIQTVVPKKARRGRR